MNWLTSKSIDRLGRGNDESERAWDPPTRPEDGIAASAKEGPIISVLGFLGLSLCGCPSCFCDVCDIAVADGDDVGEWPSGVGKLNSGGFLPAASSSSSMLPTPSVVEGEESSWCPAIDPLGAIPTTGAPLLSDPSKTTTLSVKSAGSPSAFGVADCSHEAQSMRDATPTCSYVGDPPARAPSITTEPARELKEAPETAEEERRCWETEVGLALSGGASGSATGNRWPLRTDICNGGVV